MQIAPGEKHNHAMTFGRNMANVGANVWLCEPHGVKTFATRMSLQGGKLWLSPWGKTHGRKPHAENSGMNLNLWQHTWHETWWERLTKSIQESGTSIFTGFLTPSCPFSNFSSTSNFPMINIIPRRLFHSPHSFGHLKRAVPKETPMPFELVRVAVPALFIPAVFSSWDLFLAYLFCAGCTPLRVAPVFIYLFSIY